MDIVDILRDPSWGALEAIGTISAAIVALWLGLRAINQEKRNRPDIALSFDKKKGNMIVGCMINNGPKTAHAVNLRLRNIKYTNQMFIDKIALSAKIINFGTIQNGEIETKIVCEITQDFLFF